MQWMKLNYLADKIDMATDKDAVREWITEKGYGHILNEKYAVYKSVAAIYPKSLASQFVLKAAHGSGWNLIVKDKTKVNWTIWKMNIRNLLKSNIYWDGRENVYKNLKPKLIYEKYLEDSSGFLMDYRFHCFAGKPYCVQTNVGRGTTNHTQNFYDLNCELLPFGKEIAYDWCILIDKPSQLSDMVNMASDVSKEFSYVRVDFYEINSNTIFGEMTFSPASGLPDFVPKHCDAISGQLLKLPIN